MTSQKFGFSGNACVYVADAPPGLAKDICSIIDHLAIDDTIPRSSDTPSHSAGIRQTHKRSNPFGSLLSPLVKV